MHPKTNLHDYANPTHLGTRQCVKSVEWTKEFREGPSCSKLPPHSSSTAPECHLFSFIYYLLSADSMSGITQGTSSRDLCLGLTIPRHSLLKSRFDQGCLGVNWCMRLLIIYRLSLQLQSPKVPIRFIPSSPSPEGVESGFPPRQSGAIHAYSVFRMRVPSTASFGEEAYSLPWCCYSLNEFGITLLESD